MMFDYDEQQDDQIIDGEIVAEEYDDDVLYLASTPLDDEPLEDDAAEDYEEIADPARRGFLTRLVLGGMAAAALGGSAAVVVNERGSINLGATATPEGVATPLGAAPQAGAGAAVADTAQIQNALAAVTADRDRLLGELGARDAELNEVREALQAALAELEEHRNLNSLWQQLDNVGLDALLGGALIAVGGNLGNLARVAVLLRQGLEVGQSVVDWFLAAMLRPQNSMRWLQRQTNALSTSLDWLVSQVQDTMQPAARLADALTDFVLWVLSRLPFGVGARAEKGLNAMKTVVNQLPDLVTGVSVDVLDPLADWFGSDDGRNLKGMFVTPVVDNVFQPARDVLARFEELQSAYEAQMAQPAAGKLAERDALRQQIREAQSRLQQSA